MKVLLALLLFVVAGCTKQPEEITVVTPTAETQVSEKKLEVDQNGSEIILSGAQYEPVSEKSVRTFLEEHPHTFHAVYNKDEQYIEAEFTFEDTGASWTIAMTNEVLDKNTISQGEEVADETALNVLKDMVHFVEVTIEA